MCKKKCRWFQVAILLLSLLFCGHVQGQKNAIQIQFDNDFITDRYYTAGVYMSYFRAFDQKQNATEAPPLSNFLKLTYGLELYTPAIYTQESFEEKTQDRPFAAGRFVSIGYQRPVDPDKIKTYTLKVGAVGPQTKGQEIQDWFHRLLGFYSEIIGWEDQIANQWIVNYDYQRLKEWRLEDNAAISAQTEFGVGLANNYFRQGINVRIGEFNSLANSTWTAPRRISKSGKFKKETFLKMGMALEYVASNIFIEGSFINKKSVFTKEAKPLVFTGSFGVYVGKPKIDISFECVYQSPVVDAAKSHFYLSFGLGKAF